MTGSAQAFNMWLKEYIFNALLQPFHLIIYTVFVGSAMDLASKNPIYAIVALAFITPAEKILRKFFGFEKASTAGTLGAFANMAGGAAAYKALSNAVNRHGGKGGKGGGGNNKDIRTKNPPIKDPNAPTSVDGYTGHNDGDVSELPESREPLENNMAGNEPLENKYANLSDNELHDKIYENQEEAFAAADLLDDDNLDDEDREYLLAEMRKAHEESTRLNEERINRQNQNDNADTPSTDEIREQVNNQEQQSTSAQITDNSNQRGGIIGGVRGSARAISNRWSETMGNKSWKREKGKNLGVKALKGGVHIATRAAAAVPTAMLGLAAGIAGDNLEDVLTYGIGGATLGATVGGNTAVNAVDRIGSGIANSAAVQGFRSGFSGNNSVQRQLARQKQQLVASSDFQQQVNMEYGDGELSGKKLIQETERAADYYNYGYTDPSKIASAMKVEDKIKGDMDAKHSSMTEEARQRLAKQQAATAMKMADKVDPKKLTNEQYVNDQIKSWKKTIQSKEPTLSDKEAQKNAEEIMKRVKQIHKID